MAFFQKDAPLQNKICFFIGAALFVGGMLCTAWAAMRNDGVLLALFFIVALSPILFATVWVRRKAARDPLLAAHLAEAKERRQKTNEARIQVRMKAAVANGLGFLISLCVMYAIHTAGYGIPPSWHLPASAAFFAIYCLSTLTVLLAQHLLSRPRENA